jgi:hypothetical protein
LNSAVYRLRVFFVMTFLQMVFELNIWSGLAGQGHYGDTAAIRAARQDVLDAAHRQHPERFVRKPPAAPAPPPAVWINPPKLGKAP